MTRLSWVQPPDLLAHELVASAHEGKDIDAVRARWTAAGGSVEAPVSGVGPRCHPSLHRLADALLDELDAQPVDPALDAREPTGWAAIAAMLPSATSVPATRGTDSPEAHRQAVLGAWLGRAAGCLLGKPVEKIPRHGIREILVAQGRWPLRSWFTAEGLPPDLAQRWPWNRRSAPTSLAENISGMPEDDDLNYCLIALSVLERVGSDFCPDDVADEWLASLPAARVFTAERAAYRNLLLGETPPGTALRRNPFREWIGAQIRTDVYGWTNPADPVAAAELAWRDAVVSHVRSGVYGAMFAAAMCAQAVVSEDVDEVVQAGLTVVPPHSRYAEAVRHGVRVARAGGDIESGLDAVYADYGRLHWVHALGNACLVAFALTRSRGDFADAICTVVTGGWDTDSNGATVGSVCGALAGADRLPGAWVEPLHNRLASSIPGFDGIGFDTLTDRSLAVTKG